MEQKENMDKSLYLNLAIILRVLQICKKGKHEHNVDRRFVDMFQYAILNLLLVIYHLFHRLLALDLKLSEKIVSHLNCFVLRQEKFVNLATQTLSI